MVPSGTPAILPEGSVFQGRYQVVRCIRAGGMGAVYEVVHLETKRRRALKLMLPSIVQNAEMRARFKLEATVAAEIESEHIVETFDAGIDPETDAPFLVMELLRGEDLAAVLQKRGALGAEETVFYLSQAALALDKTHAAGVVHRDLKPENLFVTLRDDGAPRIKILDFGIAKVVSESAQTAKQTATIGTPLYMSPEQIKGDGGIGPRADLYALGHIAFALLTGKAYWEDEEAGSSGALYSLLLKVMEGPQEPPSARAARRGRPLPPSFDAWFAKATARDPRHRFERASETIAALAAALGTTAPRSSLGSMPMSMAVPPGSLSGHIGQGSTPMPLGSSYPYPPARSSGLQGAETFASARVSSAGTPVNALGLSGRTTAAVASERLSPASKSSALPLALGAIGLCAALGVGGWVWFSHARSAAQASAELAASAALAAPPPVAPTTPPAPIPTPQTAPKSADSAAAPEPTVTIAASADKKKADAPARPNVPSRPVTPPPTTATPTVRKTME